MYYVRSQLLMSMLDHIRKRIKKTGIVMFPLFKSHYKIMLSSDKKVEIAGL
jgi:hypothetical protein